MSLTPRCNTSRRSAIAAAAILAATAAASPLHAAEELRPIEGKSLQLGEMSGIAFYTIQDHGYHVVAIISGPNSGPVRFEGMLLPGQKVVVSVPGTPRATAQKIEFSRQGDSLLMETLAPQLE